MERPTIRQLEYIVALADAGHFGRAAEQAGVSQPGLSSQIRDVERRLGVTLFERTTRTVRPTPVGEAVVEWSRSVLLSVDEMVLEAREHARGLRGQLRVGVIPTMAPYLLPRLVADVRANFPDVRLEIIERQSEHLIDDIERGRLDLGLLATPYDTRNLQVASISHEEFLLALPDDHPLGDRDAVALDELSDLSVLLLPEGHCLREHARAACEVSGKVEHSEVKGASLSTLCQMVAAGIGVTLLPAGAVEVEARKGSGVRCVPFADTAPGRTVALIWRGSDPRAGSYEELAGLLRPATFDAGGGT